MVVVMAYEAVVGVKAEAEGDGMGGMRGTRGDGEVGTRGTAGDSAGGEGSARADGAGGEGIQDPAPAPAPALHQAFSEPISTALMQVARGSVPDFQPLATGDVLHPWQEELGPRSRMLHGSCRRRWSESET